jgi:DNA invertase Pin-like site-specific DNA recombinase
MATGRFVAYYRLSTECQGASNLGLEAQRQAVHEFLTGDRRKLLDGFTEVESGKRADRPELAKAFAACRLHRATLVIAKLDRLSRDAAFLLNLRDADVDFVAADMPDANRMTVGILACVAEHEREAISQRTKAALAAAKARGKRLGNPGNLSAKAAAVGRQRGNAAGVDRAARRSADLAPVLAEIKASGITSLGGIARALNERGIPTARGQRTWQAVQVQRVLERIGG